VAQIINIGNTKVTFCQDYCIIMTTSPIHHKSITYKINKGGLFSLGIGIEPPVSNDLAITKPDLKTQRWHCLNIKYLHLMQIQDLVKGLPNLKSTLPT